MTHDELGAIVASKMDNPNTTAKEILDTIREALMEPTEEMRSAAEEADWEADYDITFADYWRAMLAASPLGEKK